MCPSRPGGVSLALSGLGMTAALCCGPVRVSRAVLEEAGRRCVPEQSSYNRRGRSRSYICGSLTKLIISSLKSLVSLAAGGSAPGPPTYTIPASLEKVAEDLAPLGPQPPFSRSSGDTETTQISRHTTNHSPRGRKFVLELRMVSKGQNIVIELQKAYHGA